MHQDLLLVDFFQTDYFYSGVYISIIPFRFSEVAAEAGTKYLGHYSLNH